ncbi:Dynamin-3 [Manis pentadactyla]|nr:Dynamin-3 [Manis pentadactyla]
MSAYALRLYVSSNPLWGTRPCECQHLLERRLAAPAGVSGRGPAPLAPSPPPVPPAPAPSPRQPAARGRWRRGGDTPAPRAARPSLCSRGRDAARSPEARGEGTGSDRSPVGTPSCRPPLGFEERGAHPDKVNFGRGNLRPGAGSERRRRAGPGSGSPRPGGLGGSPRPTPASRPRGPGAAASPGFSPPPPRAGSALPPQCSLPLAVVKETRESLLPKCPP